MARSSAKRGDLEELLRVRPGTRVDLSRFDPDETHGRSKDDAAEELEDGLSRLAELQDRLWAEGRRRVLVVLQGIDAAGKDGTLRHVMGAFNPQGCYVTSFKVPSEVELAHDYLWRVHRHVPANGEIAIFNRSHYEDVLVVRVHDLVPKPVWSRRFEQINAFERLLVEEGTAIVKFFLHIDRDEQQERFEARLADPTKRWKFRSGDLDERARWGDYIEAYEDVLSNCSTDDAPWYVVPANRKWFRNLAVANILGDALEKLDSRYPDPEENLGDIVIH